MSARYYFKRKSRKLMPGLASITSDRQRSCSVESTYVAKPRYHHKRKSRKPVRWLAYITSDWQRLTSVTLIVMLVCGLGIVAVLNLLRLNEAAEPSIITEASAPDYPQNDLQPSTPAQQVPSTPSISDASAERSILAEKKSDDRGGPQVNNEHSSRLRVAEPLPKSSKRVDELHPKKALTPKQQIQSGSRSAQSSRSLSVSRKSIPSTNAVGADQKAPSRAKAPPHRVPSSSSLKTQRPRRVAGRDDRLTPAATAGRNTKGKVIQWP